MSDQQQDHDNDGARSQAEYAALAVMNDVSDMWERRSADASRTPRERLAWAEAAMDLRAAVDRQDLLRYEASPETLDELEAARRDRLNVGAILDLHDDGDLVRVTKWQWPWFGFRFEVADPDRTPGEDPDGPGTGVARISAAPDPTLAERFQTIIDVDGSGDSRLPDPDTGEITPLRELVRRHFLAMED